MTPEEFQRVDEVFQRAVTLAPPDRSGYLDVECTSEPEVRAHVEALLARDDAPHRMLDFEPRVPEVSSTRPTTPSTIGPYRVLGVLGSGAMGVVYRAEQENPRRLVAVKLMRTGLSSPSALRRFRREAELLGRLKHAGVASVIEAGTTPVAGDPGGAAQPYFVMELIDGRSLLEHVRHHDLTARGRVELIVRICDAVEHAHLSGIVHRDLKPANILVTEDGTSSGRTMRDAAPVGQPKVLDFGVARIMDADRIAATMQTSAGELVGTLPYMSPEQLAGDPDAVDTRSDVYALGVLLFEVLTGRRPHEVAGKSLAEAVRLICDETPMALGAVDRRLRGDLDTIVATATARDVDRRYASVAQLSGDLRRYLADEPILARPPTTVYQLRKFARRNRGLVTGVVTALVVLIAGLVTSSILYTRAESRAELMRRALYVQRITLGLHALESEDGREVAALLEACPPDLRHWEWRRLKFLADRSERTLRGHAGGVMDVAFGPAGRFMVTGGGHDEMTVRSDLDRTVRVWNAEDGTLRRVIPGRAGSIRSVAVSPDGRYLATLSRRERDTPGEGRLRLWTLDDGALVAERQVHPTTGCGLSFTPGGTGLVVGGGLGRVALVDVARFEVIWADGDPVIMTGVAVTPDGERIAASAWSGEVTVYETRSGRVLWSRPVHTRVAHSIAMSPDGSTIATGSKDRTVRVLDLETGAGLASLPDHGALVASVAFAPDGRLASGDADGVIRIHDPETGVELQVLIGHEDRVQRLAFAPYGSRLASASRDGTVRLWQIDDAPADLAWSPHGDNEVNEVRWGPDGRRLLTVGDDAHVRVIDTRTDAELFALPHDEQFVHAADWTDDGARIVSLESHGDLALWDGETGRALEVWRGHEDWSFAASFAPGGRLLATGARGELKIWDGRTGDLVHALDSGATDVLSLAWSHDGAVLASGTLAGSVTLWNPVRGVKSGTLPGTGSPVDALAFDPEGKLLAASDRAGVVHLFDWSRRRTVRTVVFPVGSEALGFSPDGLRLLAGGRDGRLRLVDPRTGETMMTLKAHRSGVMSAAFSPDGTRIASTSRDFTARILNAVGP